MSNQIKINQDAVVAVKRNVIMKLTLKNSYLIPVKKEKIWEVRSIATSKMVDGH